MVILVSNEVHLHKIKHSSIEIPGVVNILKHRDNYTSFLNSHILVPISVANNKTTVQRMLLISSVLLGEFGQKIEKIFIIKTMMKFSGILNLQSYILIGL